MRNWEWEDGHSSVCKGPRRLTCAACVPVFGPVKLEVDFVTEATSLPFSPFSGISD